ncbi:MAG: hypothetical protein MZV64_02245 [Ignavibacteriales bacterium]|nr:hypothetical protein [Ignavibacteriales bacterium]
MTQFAVQPGFIKKPGSDEEDAQQMKVRVAQIASLQKDIGAGALRRTSAHRSACAGQALRGHRSAEHAQFGRALDDPCWKRKRSTKSASPLAIALGRDVSGQPLVADLARMPHLLIAGRDRLGQIGLHHLPLPPALP